MLFSFTEDMQIGQKMDFPPKQMDNSPVWMYFFGNKSYGFLICRNYHGDNFYDVWEKSNYHGDNLNQHGESLNYP